MSTYKTKTEVHACKRGSEYKQLHVHVYTHTTTCTCIHTHIQLHVHVYTHKTTCTCIHTHTSNHILMCIIQSCNQLHQMMLPYMYHVCTHSSLSLSNAPYIHVCTCSITVHTHEMDLLRSCTYLQICYFNGQIPAYT